jgi:tetratricopeptide (TPR) repeat protein
MQDGDFEEAERALHQATLRFPVVPAAFLSHAAVAERMGHFDNARRSLIEYEALTPNDGEFVGHATRIAALSIRVNDPETASDWIRKGLDKDPQNATLLALTRRVATQSRPSPLRIGRVPQAVPKEIEAEHQDRNRQTGKDRQMRRIEQMCPSTVQHRPPTGSWRLDAETEKTERASPMIAPAMPSVACTTTAGHGGRNDMMPEDARHARALRSGSLHVFELTRAQAPGRAPASHSRPSR